MYFSWRCCVPAGGSHSLRMRQTGGERTKDEEVESATRSKGTEGRHGGCRGTKRWPKKWCAEEGTAKPGEHGVYKYSACRDGRWKAQRARGHRYICRRECWKIMKKSDDEVGRGRSGRRLTDHGKCLRNFFPHDGGDTEKRSGSRVAFSRCADLENRHHSSAIGH